MKSSVIVAIVVLGLLALSGFPAAAGRREHTARGNVLLESGFTFTFEATGTPKRATGRFRSVAPDGASRVGDLKCLATARQTGPEGEGKLAAMAGKFRDNGQFFVVMARDNGPVQDPPVDEFLFFFTRALTPCGDLLDAEVTLNPVVSGNIRVR